MSKRYVGTRQANTSLSVRVYWDNGPATGTLLPKRLDLRNHSPTGFECGYGGSGPAQLALAILANHMDSDPAALRYYHKFKFHTIARLPRHDDWTLTSEEIDAALREMGREPPTSEECQPRSEETSQ